MIERMSGTDAESARKVSRDTGISQETLSRWLRQARSLPLMPRPKRTTKGWSIDEKIRVLAEAAKVTGIQLTALLEREGLLLAELEQWRLALDEEGRASKATVKRIGKLERELARKEKALAEQVSGMFVVEHSTGKHRAHSPSGSLRLRTALLRSTRSQGDCGFPTAFPRTIVLRVPHGFSADHRTVGSPRFSSGLPTIKDPASSPRAFRRPPNVTGSSPGAAVTRNASIATRAADFFDPPRYWTPFQPQPARNRAGGQGDVSVLGARGGVILGNPAAAYRLDSELPPVSRGDVAYPGRSVWPRGPTRPRGRMVPRRR
jgi:transposase